MRCGISVYADELQYIKDCEDGKDRIRTLD